MKIQASNALVKNLVALFDQDGDNQINLAEFERQMSKYLDAGRGLKDLPEPKQVQEEMKQELRQQINSEPKKQVNFQDFSLKPFEQEDVKRKEALVVEALKKGQMPVETVCGEVKLQFEDGVNLISVMGKAVPVIGLTITYFSNDGSKKEHKLYSEPCVDFMKTNVFNTAVAIPLINQDKVRVVFI